MLRNVELMMGSGLGAVAGPLIAAQSGFGQVDERSTAARLGFRAGMLFGLFIFLAGFYVYIALALQTIAKKTNSQNAWWAWIPILNLLLMLNIAKKPLWWIILLLIPFVSVVIGIIVWMRVAEACGKPSWWGILMIVPVANLVVPGYLAWSS